MATVAGLTALTELHLDGRSFTDLALRAISPLTRLRVLDLFGARISDAGCVHLRSVRAAMAAVSHTRHSNPPPPMVTGMC